MDPSQHYSTNLTLAEMDAQTYGFFTPAFAAFAVISYRLLCGRWPHPVITLGSPVAIMLGGLAWMLVAMATDAPATTVAEAFARNGGIIRGLWLYVVPVGIGAALEFAVHGELAWQRPNVRGQRRRRRSSSREEARL